MERIKLKKGVHLACDPAQRFNCCRLSMHFMVQAEREKASARAVLPMLLERGYSDCPDMTELSKRLAALYGAALSVDIHGIGNCYELCVSVTGIRNCYALDGEDLVGEYLRLLLGVAFHPHLPGGLFDRDALAIEAGVLRRNLEDEINDKRYYCSMQAQRKFFGDSPAGIEPNGYPEELPGLTAEQVTEAYHDLISHAQIELIALGFDEQERQRIGQALCTELDAVKREPEEISIFSVQKRRQPEHFNEQLGTKQAKICLLFTQGRQINVLYMAPFRMALALLGTTPTSRLFMNVREKQGLCYYCAASISTFCGCMTIQSGCEPENADKVEKAILNELSALCGGPISDEEFENCRRSVLAGMKGVEDSLSGIENWYFHEFCRGQEPVSPSEAREQLEWVSKNDVRAVLNAFSLSVSYRVTPNGEEEV